MTIKRDSESDSDPRILKFAFLAQKDDGHDVRNKVLIMKMQPEAHTLPYLSNFFSWILFSGNSFPPVQHANMRFPSVVRPQES